MDKVAELFTVHVQKDIDQGEIGPAKNANTIGLMLLHSTMVC